MAKKVVKKIVNTEAIKKSIKYHEEKGDLQTAERLKRLLK